MNAINKAKVASEIIIIDNYSTNGTFEILKILRKELRNNRYIIRFMIIRKNVLVKVINIFKNKL
jgi:hypothetical protein